MGVFQTTISAAELIRRNEESRRLVAEQQADRRQPQPEATRPTAQPDRT
jgi:hypothetical protein